jgi:hypothetical protein
MWLRSYPNFWLLSPSQVLTHLSWEATNSVSRVSVFLLMLFIRLFVQTIGSVAQRGNSERSEHGERHVFVVDDSLDSPV